MAIDNATEIPTGIKTSKNPQIQQSVDNTKSVLRSKYPNTDENLLNQQARDRVASEIIRDRLRREIGKAKEAAITDNLTGLKSKSLFDATLDQEIATVERDRRSFPLELTVMDIDNFGAFNKQYGIPTGDEVLKMVGTTINNTLRTSDLAFRIGGEELAIISRKTHNPEKSGDKLISERHNEAIKNAQSENGHSVTVSIGQADFIRGEDRKTFIDRANTALIVAKRLGKDRAVIGEVIEGKEVYIDTLTKKKYSVLKDTDGKLLEIIEINTNG